MAETRPVHQSADWFANTDIEEVARNGSQRESPKATEFGIFAQDNSRRPSNPPNSAAAAAAATAAAASSPSRPSRVAGLRSQTGSPVPSSPVKRNNSRGDFDFDDANLPDMSSEAAKVSGARKLSVSTMAETQPYVQQPFGEESLSPTGGSGGGASPFGRKGSNPSPLSRSWSVDQKEQNQEVGGGGGVGVHVDVLQGVPESASEEGGKAEGGGGDVAATTSFGEPKGFLSRSFSRAEGNQEEKMRASLEDVLKDELVDEILDSQTSGEVLEESLEGLVGKSALEDELVDEIMSAHGGDPSPDDDVAVPTPPPGRKGFASRSGRRGMEPASVPSRSLEDMLQDALVDEILEEEKEEDHNKESNPDQQAVDEKASALSKGHPSGSAKGRSLLAKSPRTLEPLEAGGGNSPKNKSLLCRSDSFGTTSVPLHNSKQHHHKLVTAKAAQPLKILEGDGISSLRVKTKAVDALLTTSNPNSRVGTPKTPGLPSLTDGDIPSTPTTPDTPFTLSRALTGGSRWQKALQKMEAESTISTPKSIPGGDAWGALIESTGVKTALKRRGRKRLSVKAIEKPPPPKSDILDEKVVEVLSVPLKQRVEDRTEELLPLLRHLRFFAQLPQALALRLIKYCKLVRRVRHEQIMGQGKAADRIYVLVQGKACAYKLEDKSEHLDWIRTFDPDAKKTLGREDSMTETPSDTQAGTGASKFGSKFAKAGMKVKSTVTNQMGFNKDKNTQQLDEMARSVLAHSNLKKYGTKFDDHTQGASFGEAEMAQGTTYSHSVLADTVCEVIVIRKQFFSMTMPRHYAMKLADLHYDLLKIQLQHRNHVRFDPLLLALNEHPIFRSVPSSLLLSVVKKIVLQQLPPFHRLYSEYEPGALFYVMVSGSVSLHSKAKDLAAQNLHNMNYGRKFTVSNIDLNACSARARELWKYAMKAVLGPVFGSPLLTSDRDASPYSMPESKLPVLDTTKLLGATLRETEDITYKFGSCYKIEQSGATLGCKELCLGERHQYTAITRCPTEILVFDHVSHAQVLKGSIGREEERDPEDVLREFIRKPLHRRSIDVAENMMGYLRGKYAFFKTLSNGVINKILLRGQHHKTSALEVVFQQGDPADYFFLILSGDVTIHITQQHALLGAMKTRRLQRGVTNAFINAHYDQMDKPRWAMVNDRLVMQSYKEILSTYGEEIRRLTEGATFGDLGISKAKNVGDDPKKKIAGRRAATIVSGGPSEFLILTCEEYDQLVREHVERSSYEMQAKILKQLPVFGKFDKDNLQRCATWMVFKSVVEGDHIARMHDDPSSIYFIIEGTAKVTFNSAMHPWFDTEGLNIEEQEEQEMGLIDDEMADATPTMHAGQIFGAYEHLMRQRSYTKSLVATSYVEVYVAQAASFLKELDRQTVVISARAKFMSWCFEQAKKLEQARKRLIIEILETKREIKHQELAQRMKYQMAMQHMDQTDIQEHKRVVIHQSIPRHLALGGVAQASPGRSKKKYDGFDHFGRPKSTPNGFPDGSSSGNDDPIEWFKRKPLCSVCCPSASSSLLAFDSNRTCPHMPIKGSPSPSRVSTPSKGNRRERFASVGNSLSGLDTLVARHSSSN